MDSTPILGASLPLTGPEATYGAQLLHAVELALEDEPAGVVSLHVEDDGSDQAKASTAAERLAANPRILAVIGPMNSWTCEIAAPIFAGAGLAHLTPSASNPALTQRGWRTLFRMCANDLVQGRVLAAVAQDLAGARRVGAVHDRTSFGAAVARVFLDESRRLGLEADCLAEITWGEPESFARAARIVADARSDAVFVVGLEEPCRLAAVALRDAGVNAVLLGTDAIKPTRVLVTPGFTGAGPYLTYSGTDAAQQAPAFHQRFEARFGPHYSIYTVEAYDAARLLVSAMRRAERPDRAAVLDVIRASEGYRGLGGHVRFGPTGERIDAAVAIYRYDGKDLQFVGARSDVAVA